MKKNAFYAQSGGVTAVINASAAGVIETCRKHRDRIGKVYAGRNGIIGALTEDLIDTSKESAASIRALRHTPSGAFGSCRFKLKGLDENRAEYERLVAEMQTLIVELRSATAGVGTFTFAYDHLAELTGKLAEQVLAASAAQAA